VHALVRAVIARGIVPVAAVEPVGADAAVEVIVVVLAVEPVGAQPTEQVVVLVPAEETVVVLAASSQSTPSPP
jgi:hypothetical protein